jgi:hypothetical protein
VKLVHRRTIATVLSGEPQLPRQNLAEFVGGYSLIYSGSIDLEPVVLQA